MFCMRLLGAKLKRRVSKGVTKEKRAIEGRAREESYGDQNRIRGVENVGFSSGDGKSIVET